MKDLTGIVMGFVSIVVGIIFILLLFSSITRATVWLSMGIYPWLLSINSLAALVLIFVLLPNAIYSSVPVFAGKGMVITSYVFGATLWVYSIILTYALWGTIALVIGLFIFGLGVVPIAMLATSLNGMWSELGQLFLGLAITFGVRIWGNSLLAKAIRNQWDEAILVDDESEEDE